MSTVTLARTLAIATAIAAAGISLVTREPTPHDEEQPSSRSNDTAPTQNAARPTSAAPSEAGDNAAAARLRELNRMSETFRNTTFLIAIRDAGFVCNELLGVYGGVNDSTTWTASCNDMLAYTVRVAQNGGLGIEPVLQHLDGLPFTPTRDSGNEILLPAPAPR
jgi:hypothetical protein